MRKVNLDSRRELEEEEKLEGWDSDFEEEAVLGMKCWSNEDLTWLSRWWKDFEQGWRVGNLGYVPNLKSEEENGVKAFHCLEC